jgi:hypothetical protein
MAAPRRVTHSRGSSWEITYRVDGRMVRRRFGTKKQAEDALARARTEITDGVHLPPIHRKVTLEEYGGIWLSTLQVRPQTRYSYEHYFTKHVVPALGTRPLASLRRSDIQAFVVALSHTHLGPRTVDAVYKIVAMICRSAVYDQRLQTSPCFKIKVPEAPPRTLQALAPDQVRRLLSTCKDEHRAVLAVGVGAGLRQAEALGLCAAHINLLKKELRVERQCLTLSVGERQPFLTDHLKTKASRRRVPCPTSSSRRWTRTCKPRSWGRRVPCSFPPAATCGGATRSTPFCGSQVWSARGWIAVMGSTRCGTRTRPGSSRRESIHASSKLVSGTLRSPKRWTPTATCSRTPTKPPPARSTICSDPLPRRQARPSSLRPRHHSACEPSTDLHTASAPDAQS